jgi:pyrroline-5-carboxylate reductase
MSSNFPSLAFIGGGNMARSLIGGLIARGQNPAAIRVAEPHVAQREGLERGFGVPVFNSSVEAVAGADLWVLAVKPQVLAEICATLAPLAQAQRPLVLSIAAGITTSQLDRWLGGGLAIVRAMPNTPALIGMGITALFANACTKHSQRERSAGLLAAVGPTVWIDDEKHMDAVTAVSGSGPAYLFLLAEAMEAAGVAQGLSKVVAQALVRQTLHGAARMLVDLPEPAEVLRQRVTSPGGTTEAAIDTFEAGGFRALVNAAITAATRRGAQLSAGNE